MESGNVEAEVFANSNLCVYLRYLIVQLYCECGTTMLGSISGPYKNIRPCGQRAKELARRSYRALKAKSRESARFSLVVFYITPAPHKTPRTTSLGDP